MAVRVV